MCVCMYVCVFVCVYVFVYLGFKMYKVFRRVYPYLSQKENTQIVLGQWSLKK